MMKKERDISLFTKITLIVICIGSIFCLALYTYSTRISMGNSVDEAFQAGLNVFVVSLIMAAAISGITFAFVEVARIKTNNVSYSTGYLLYS